MAHTDTSADARPHVSPQLIVGAVSPLWGYFGAATAGGVAFWWMTRWTQPANLESMFDRALEAIAPPAAADALVEMVEETAQAVVAATEAVLPFAPEPVTEPEPVAVVEAEAAPAAETIPEPAPEFALDAAPKARSKKTAPAEEQP